MDTVDGVKGKKQNDPKIGPGAKWVDDNKIRRQHWHYQWFFAIPYILCIHIFISTLHFPDGLIGRYVKDNIWVAGIVGNIFNAVEEWLEAIGFAGGGKQGESGWNGSVSQFNILFMLTTCVTTMLSRYSHKGFGSYGNIIDTNHNVII